MAKGFLLGATAGRTTLNGEGLQHEDGHSLLHCMAFTNIQAYDPAFAFELATIIEDGMHRMYTNNEAIFYYITVYNEDIKMPPMPGHANWAELNGKEADPHSIMPLVLLNPQIEHLSPEETGTEGCLSFPKIYGDISRPERIRLKALNKKGEPTDFICGGLLSPCIQHETDHLHGILFTDRMDRESKADIKEDLNELLKQTKADMIEPEA